MMHSTDTVFKGIIPAMPTPLTDKKELDLPGLERLINHVLAGGVHGLWVLGSAGEVSALSGNDRDAILTAVVEQVARRVPVVVGVIDNSLTNIIKRAELARLQGADACFVTLPFYFSTNQLQALRFVKDVSSRVPLPVVFYENPF